MNVSSPAMSPQFVESAKKLIWNGVAAILTALIAAALAWFVTSRTNTQMALQQEEMTVIGQFDESGASLDSCMSDFLDGLVDGGVAPETRKLLRTAIALHAAKAQRLANVIGAKPVNEYTQGLAKLREMVDTADDVQAGMPTARLHADILANKKRISDAAWARISKR